MVRASATSTTLPMTGAATTCNPCTHACFRYNSKLSLIWSVKHALCTLASRRQMHACMQKGAEQGATHYTGDAGCACSAGHQVHVVLRLRPLPCTGASRGVPVSGRPHIRLRTEACGGAGASRTLQIGVDDAE